MQNEIAHPWGMSSSPGYLKDLGESARSLSGSILFRSANSYA